MIFYLIYYFVNTTARLNEAKKNIKSIILLYKLARIIKVVITVI